MSRNSYVVVSAPDAETLGQRVQTYLDRDFMPHGSMSVVRYAHDSSGISYWYFYQPMVRT